MRAKLACLLLFAMSWSLAAFGDEETTTPAYPPFIISYWVGPPMEEATLERYQEIADCGFNLAFTPLMPSGEPSVADNMKVLDLCQTVGLKAIIQDSRMLTRQPDDPEFDKNLDAIVATYSKHPALAGYLLRDEPTAELFPELAGLTKGLLQRDPRRLPFISLLPGCGPSYEQYVRRYINTVKPPLVQWDHYPLRVDAQGKHYEETNYFENLEIGSRLSREAGLPFQQTILAAPHRDYRDPSEADLRWEVYTTLCYGAKGIMYFTYWSLPPHGVVNAVINEKNQRAEKYAMVREINRRIKALAPTLVKLRGVRVAHTAPLPDGTRGLDKYFPVTKVEGGPLVLGWLRDHERRDYLFLVNGSLREEATFSVLLRNKVQKVEEISQDDGKPIEAVFDLGSLRLTASLKAGEGKLFRLSL